jgi:hypothetical protein
MTAAKLERTVAAALAVEMVGKSAVMLDALLVGQMVALKAATSVF